jgi:RNA recognition motif-containing protein
MYSAPHFPLDKNLLQDLKDLFRKVGDVQYADVRDGFGIVEFRDPAHNADAITEFTDYEYQGSRINVEPVS